MSNAKPAGPQLSGVVGFFDAPDSLMEATAKVRDSNYKHFDCFTPFPVHGLDAAQGLKRSPIPFVTTICAFTGTTCAFLWEYHASGDWWPHIIGGKPFNSLPAFVPIMFELSILFGGLATFWAMLFFNRLPNLSKRAFDPSITNNRFAIMIENPPLDWDDEDAVKAHHFSPEEVESYLKSLGAKDVRKVFEEGWF